MLPKPAPKNRYAHNTVLLRDGRSLLVFAGHGGRTRYYKDVHLLDTSTNVWYAPVVTGTIPTKRSGHSLASVGDLCFAYGGFNGKEILSDLWCLDVRTFAWAQVRLAGGSLPPLVGHSCTTLTGSNEMVIFGGSSASSRLSAALYVVSADTLSVGIVPVAQAPAPRFWHACELLGDRLLCFGGSGIKAVAYNDLVSINIGLLRRDPASSAALRASAGTATGDGAGGAGGPVFGSRPPLPAPEVGQSTKPEGKMSMMQRFRNFGAKTITPPASVGSNGSGERSAGGSTSSQGTAHLAVATTSATQTTAAEDAEADKDVGALLAEAVAAHSLSPTGSMAVASSSTPTATTDAGLLAARGMNKTGTIVDVFDGTGSAFSDGGDTGTTSEITTPLYIPGAGLVRAGASVSVSGDSTPKIGDTRYPQVHGGFGGVPLAVSVAPSTTSLSQHDSGLGGAGSTSLEERKNILESGLWAALAMVNDIDTDHMGSIVVKERLETLRRHLQWLLPQSAASGARE